MPHLVRDHVGLRKISRRSVFVLQIAVEVQVDLNTVIARAIEGAHFGSRVPAAGLNLVAEQHELRLLVLPPHLLEDRAPDVFRIRQHHGDESGLIVLRRIRIALDLRRAARLGRGLHERPRITSEEEVNDGDDDTSNSAAHNETSPASAASTVVLYVFTFASALPEHAPESSRTGGSVCSLLLHLRIPSGRAVRTASVPEWD